jgi:hypothetical protein
MCYDLGVTAKNAPGIRRSPRMNGKKRTEPMDAKISGLCTTAIIIIAVAGAIPSSRSLAATTRSEEGVYESYQRYSKAPANDFWYYHPGGPFYLYANRHYAYVGRHAHHRTSSRGAHWRHEYAWRGGYGRWGGPPVDGRCWSGEPSVWGWRQIRVC